MNEIEIEVLRCYAAYEKDGIVPNASDISVISGLTIAEVRAAAESLVSQKRLAKVNSTQRRIPSAHRGMVDALIHA